MAKGATRRDRGAEARRPVAHRRQSRAFRGDDFEMTGWQTPGSDAGQSFRDTRVKKPKPGETLPDALRRRAGQGHREHPPHAAITFPPMWTTASRSPLTSDPGAHHRPAWRGGAGEPRDVRGAGGRTVSRAQAAAGGERIEWKQTGTQGRSRSSGPADCRRGRPPRWAEDAAGPRRRHRRRAGHGKVHVGEL